MAAKPTVVPVTSLSDAASLGVDLALQERMAVYSTTDPTLIPDPSTTGIYPTEPPTTEPVVY